MIDRIPGRPELRRDDRGRRLGVGRRIQADRRLVHVAAPVERRGQSDRREGLQRRAPSDRRLARVERP